MTRADRDQPAYDDPLTCSRCQDAVPAREHLITQSIGPGQVRRSRAVLCDGCAQLERIALGATVEPVCDEVERAANARDERAIAESREQ